MADVVQTLANEGVSSDDALLGYKRTLVDSTQNASTHGEDEPGNADSNSAGAGDDQSDVGISTERFDALEKRFNDSQQHIGRLEGENKALREQIETRPPVDPSQDVSIEDPLNDPDFVEKYKATFGEDEIAAEANLTMLRNVRDSIVNQYETKIDNLQQGYQQQVYYDQVKTAMYNGMQDAIQTYGEPAEQLVSEFIQSQGSFGALADAIQANKAVAESADLVSALIGRLIWKAGGQPQPQPEINQQPQVNPASRPTHSQTVETTEDEVPVDRQIAQSIVDAKSPSQALPFMR